MREVVRYSEAFKLRLVEDMANGKYQSLDEAWWRNGIRGATTVSKKNVITLAERSKARGTA
jgi:hypothetical protein